MAPDEAFQLSVGVRLWFVAALAGESNMGAVGTGTAGGGGGVTP